MAEHVVVVGGGLAGLASAVALAEAGRQVTLLESRPRLGGATASFTRDGVTVDTGQHVFLGCCTAYRGFLQRLNVEHLTELQPRLDVPVLYGEGSDVRKARLRRSRLPLPPPLHLSGGLLRYQAMPLRERLRSVPAVLLLARLNQLDPAVDAQSFGRWLADHGQAGSSLPALWELLTVATLNAHPQDASLALAAKVVRTGLLETPGGADIGFSRVPLGRLHGESALAHLESLGARVSTGCRVRGVRQAGKSWAVETDGGGFDADAVVLAAPHTVVADLAPADAGLDPAGLRGLGSSPIVNVHIFYDRPVMDEPFMAAIGSPVQWVFDRTSAAGVRSGQYLAISLSAAGQWQQLKVAELEAIFVAEMARLLPEAEPRRVERFFVTREPHATFDQRPGQLLHRPVNRTALPGLVVAGAWTRTGWPATMESAVRSGEAAAQELLAG
ncbi:MAG: squalene-associated FAD-dependent desaturase [Mycobacterium sp.]|nr:squalene-associated FAD-dependent desaturase [Mycobacterium sp.]